MLIEFSLPEAKRIREILRIERKRARKMLGECRASQSWSSMQQEGFLAGRAQELDFLWNTVNKAIADDQLLNALAKARAQAFVTGFQMRVNADEPLEGTPPQSDLERYVDGIFTGSEYPTTCDPEMELDKLMSQHPEE